MSPGYRITAPALSEDELAVFRQPRTDAELEQRKRAMPNLIALQSMRHMYAGTADPDQVAQRRARNKAARKSRRVNRRKAK